MDSRAKALVAAHAAAEKKGQEIIILDIQCLSPLCDYFVITSGGSSTQVSAIAEYVEEKLKGAGAILDHREGQDKSGWVLLDYGDVVVHVFHEEQRAFYDIERLWGDAGRVEVSLA